MQKKTSPSRANHHHYRASQKNAGKKVTNPRTSMAETVSESDNTIRGIYILGLTVLIFAILGGLYILLYPLIDSNDQTSSPNSATGTDTNLNQAELVSYPRGISESGVTEGYRYEGKYLQAILPNEKWRLEEITEVSQNEYLTGEYQGLIGGRVYYGEELAAQWLGTTETQPPVEELNCSQIPLFEDTNIEWYNKMIDRRVAQGESKPVFVDLTRENFTEFRLLGADFRRVQDSYFYDLATESNSFNADCSGSGAGVGGVSYLVSLPQVSFFSSGTDSSLHLYKVQFASGTEDYIYREMEALLHSITPRGD